MPALRYYPFSPTRVPDGKLYKFIADERGAFG
jgi:hypothetical protein